MMLTGYACLDDDGEYPATLKQYARRGLTAGGRCGSIETAGARARPDHCLGLCASREAFSFSGPQYSISVLETQKLRQPHAPPRSVKASIYPRYGRGKFGRRNGIVIRLTYETYHRIPSDLVTDPGGWDDPQEAARF